jgi:DNA primase
MALRLHPDTIEQIKQRADIVDVVSEHVVLKKRGKDFVGFCPFHDDKKSPSFTVSPTKQFYYCFSCGAGGNAIKFLMEIGKDNFAEVVMDLAKRYSIPVQTLEPEQRQELQRQLTVRDQLYEILALTAQFFSHALRQSDGKAALDYVQNQRHFSLEVQQHFGIGYAPPGWSTLYGYLVEHKKYPAALVEQAGLIIPRKGKDGYYDRFRDRLMIPIHDLQGRVVGFGGRALGDEEPKYLNSPETELFDKGRLLYGLDKARATIAKQDQAVVVEGYFDVIALHAAGITNAVASLGTALGTHQIKLLLRYTESKLIVLNFDADRAGNQAAERAIGEVENLAYQGDVQLRVLNIPQGKDPDEYLKSHRAADYQELLDSAPLWLDWQIQRALEGHDLKQADQFQTCVGAVVKLLGNLPNASLRTHYIHHCAQLLALGNARVALQLEEDLRQQVRGERWHGRSQKWQTKGDRTLIEEAENQLLRLFLHAPRLRFEVISALEERDLDFTLSHHRFLWRQILELEEAGVDILTDQEVDLVEMLQDRCLEFPRELGQVYHLFHLEEKTQRDILRGPLAIRAAAAAIERVRCEKRRRHFLNLFETTDLASDPAQAREHQQKAYAEGQRILELDRQRQVEFVDLVQHPLMSESMRE